MSRLSLKAVLLLAGGFLPFWAQADDAEAWLERMTQALAQTSYSGVVIREQRERSESMKIWRTIIDGVPHERLVLQEGNGLEIIRKGNDVHCVLPDRKTVLVETWSEQSTLFSPVPVSSNSFGHSYRLRIDGKDRVAGRPTVIVAIVPVDSLRFARRLWLDAETGFPLKSERLDGKGESMEQIRFADITLGADISYEQLSSQYLLDDFQWVGSSDSPSEGSTGSWHSEQLPVGFRMSSSHVEALGKKGETVTHIVYSDGLSTVSVFIKAAADGKPTTRSRLGSANAYSTRVGDYRVTAVGEVPAVTVEQIALSMRR